MTNLEWTLTSLTLLFFPFLMVVIGLLMIKFGFGFNVPGRAQASREAQVFASRTFGIWAIRTAPLALIAAIVGFVLGFRFIENSDTITLLIVTTTLVQTAIVTLPVIITVKRLNRIFDKNGKLNS